MILHMHFCLASNARSCNHIKKVYKHIYVMLSANTATVGCHIVNKQTFLFKISGEYTYSYYAYIQHQFKV